MTEAEVGQLNLEQLPKFYANRSVDCFLKLDLISHSSLGQIYMAKEIKTGEIVALKKLRTEDDKEGFPITAVREIKNLTKLHHENVIRLKEVVTSEGPVGNPEQAKNGKYHLDKSKFNGGVYLVFEYMDHDLSGLSQRPGLRFSIPQIKCYMKQLLSGLDYCHTNKVIHRDLKGANILLDNKGNLKLGNFGRACSFSHEHKPNHTNRVVTLPYRPPELLLGDTKYGPAVDIWSAGCIFAELLHGKPIMSGRNEPDQLHKVFELCGSPDEIIWPGVSRMPWYNNFKPVKLKRRRLREVFRHFDSDALDLLDKMLTLDPSKRISAKEALDAEYFWREPLPCNPKCLPKYESSHEYQTQKKREQQRLNEEKARQQGLPHPAPFCRLPPIQNGREISQEQWRKSNNSIIQQRQQPFPLPPPPPPPLPPVHSNTVPIRYVEVGPPNNRHPSSGNYPGRYNQTYGPQLGGVPTGHYPSQSQGGAGPGPGPYADAPPGFSQRGPNQNVDNRNQYYGWHQ